MILLILLILIYNINCYLLIITYNINFNDIGNINFNDINNFNDI